VNRQVKWVSNSQARWLDLVMSLPSSVSRRMLSLPHEEMTKADHLERSIGRSE